MLPKDDLRAKARASTNGNGHATTNRRNGLPFETGKYGLPQIEGLRALDWAHIIFLVYSAAHNLINAWHYSGGPIFFVFVSVGIVSVELVLWAVYTAWKKNQLVGKMERRARVAGLLAMFYATAGILAQANVNNPFFSIYYQWVLPTSAPMMFLWAFLIRSADPIAQAARRVALHQKMEEAERALGDVDAKMMALELKRDERNLKRLIHRQRLGELVAVATSGKMRRTLRAAARHQAPQILKTLKISTGKKAKWNLPLYEVEVGGEGVEKPDESLT